jgi:hypothetical protein
VWDLKPFVHLLLSPVPLCLGFDDSSHGELDWWFVQLQSSTFVQGGNKQLRDDGGRLRGILIQQEVGEEEHT